MMKKLTSMTLVLAMLLTLFAGCGNTDVQNPTTPETTEAAAELPGSALEILENTWAQFAEEEQFPIYGGDMETHNAMMEQDENYVMPSAPGNYDMAYSENLPYTLQISAELVENVDQAATMIHGMLSNNFTAGVLHLTAGTDAETFAASVNEALLTNHWMCGFPERDLVAVIGGEYVVMAFGLQENLTPFQTHLLEAYPDAQILYNEEIL